MSRFLASAGEVEMKLCAVRHMRIWLFTPGRVSRHQTHFHVGHDVEQLVRRNGSQGLRNGIRGAGARRQLNAWGQTERRHGSMRLLLGNCWSWTTANTCTLWLRPSVLVAGIAIVLLWFGVVHAEFSTFKDIAVHVPDGRRSGFGIGKLDEAWAPKSNKSDVEGGKVMNARTHAPKPFILPVSRSVTSLVDTTGPTVRKALKGERRATPEPSSGRIQARPPEFRTHIG